jgi:hypothetical protein
MTRTPSGTAVAAGLALIGVFFDRLTFVTAGQVVPRGTLAGTVSYPYSDYMPSPVEIGIILGAVAFVAMGYTLAERYLDMGEADVHVGIPWPWVKQHEHEADEHHGVVEAERPMPVVAAVVVAVAEEAAS